MKLLRYVNQILCLAYFLFLYTALSSKQEFLPVSLLFIGGAVSSYLMETYSMYKMQQADTAKKRLTTYTFYDLKGTGLTPNLQDNQLWEANNAPLRHNAVRIKYYLNRYETFQDNVYYWKLLRLGCLVCLMGIYSYRLFHD